MTPDMLTKREIEQRARTLMTQARLALLFTAPFYGQLAMRLKVQPREAMPGPMATNGIDLFYKPSIIATWPQQVVEAAFAHEVTHNACLHPFRQGERAHDLWNRACDYVVNATLKRSGFAVQPEWLYDARFEGQSAEVVYATLQREQPPAPSPAPDDAAQQPEDDPEQGEDGDDVPGDTSGTGDDPDAPPAGQDVQGDAPGEGELGAFDPAMPGAVEAPPCDPAGGAQGGCSAMPSELESQWQAAVAAALDSLAAQGDMPAGLERIAHAALRPKVDWTAEARAWLQERTQGDYSWRAPATRYLARRLFLPRLDEQRLGMLAVIRDTSGSIGASELGRFNAEIEAIAAELKPRRLVIIDADAAVAKVWDLEDGEPLPALEQAHGGGGTSFIPALDWIAQQDEDATAAVYLTDLCGRFPEREPDFPVLWVSINDAQAPFGRTVPING